MERWLASALAVGFVFALGCGGAGDGDAGGDPEAAVSAPPRLHAGLPVGQLLDDPEAKALLEVHFGPQVNQMRAVQSMTLEQIIPMSGGRLTPEIIEELDVEFERLNQERAG